MEKEAGENEILEKAKKFLNAKEVTLDRFSKLIGQVLEEKARWKKELAVILSCDFLDLLVLRGGRADNPSLKTVFDRLRKSKINVKALFAAWSAGLEPHYVSGLELAELRWIVEGKG